jgi:hypothetical protein
MTTSAFADDFNISNHTRFTMSFQVNGMCSREFGTVSSYSAKTIPEKTFMTACKENTTPCDIRIYDMDACQGEMIFEVKYNLKTQDTATTNYSSEIKWIGISGYNLFLSDVAPKK